MNLRNVLYTIGTGILILALIGLASYVLGMI